MNIDAATVPATEAYMTLTAQFTAAEGLRLISDLSAMVAEFSFADDSEVNLLLLAVQAAYEGDLPNVDPATRNVEDDDEGAAA